MKLFRIAANDQCLDINSGYKQPCILNILKNFFKGRGGGK